MALTLFVVGKCPTTELAVTNKVFAAPGILPESVRHVKITTQSGTSFLYTFGVSSGMVSWNAVCSVEYDHIFYVL